MSGEAAVTRSSKLWTADANKLSLVLCLKRIGTSRTLPVVFGPTSCMKHDAKLWLWLARVTLNKLGWQPGWQSTPLRHTCTPVQGTTSRCGYYGMAEPFFVYLTAEHAVCRVKAASSFSTV